MTVFRILSLGAVLIAAAASWQADAASADPALPTRPSALDRAAPADLQSAYLDCERQSEATLLDFGTAAHCSIIYEALKERVFGGDFRRLLKWWAQQKQATQPLPAPLLHAPSER